MQLLTFDHKPDEICKAILRPPHRELPIRRVECLVCQARFDQVGVSLARKLTFTTLPRIRAHVLIDEQLYGINNETRHVLIRRADMAKLIDLRGV